LPRSVYRRLVRVSKERPFTVSQSRSPLPHPRRRVCFGDRQPASLVFRLRGFSPPGRLAPPRPAPDLRWSSGLGVHDVSRSAPPRSPSRGPTLRSFAPHVQRTVWLSEPNHGRADVTARVAPHVHRLPCPLVLVLSPIRVTAGPPSDFALLAVRSRSVVRRHRSVIVVSARAHAALARSPIVVSPLSNRRRSGFAGHRRSLTVTSRSSCAAFGQVRKAPHHNPPKMSWNGATERIRAAVSPRLLWTSRLSSTHRAATRSMLPWFRARCSLGFVRIPLAGLSRVHLCGSCEAHRALPSCDGIAATGPVERQRTPRDPV